MAETEPEPTAPVTEAAVSEGLSSGDWASIRAAYEAGRHVAYSVEGGYQTQNPGQGWRTDFDGRGFLTRPDAGGWTWGLELERYGFAGRQQRVQNPARVSVEGGRVAYAWDTTLEEWFVNDTSGLEHGYTLRVRPPRDEQDAGSPLTFTLALRGELRAEVTSAGRGVRFLDEAGAVALTYTGLVVFDADGRELEASFERIGDGLLLSVDERGARYPLVIDPVAQRAYLKASNTDADDWFGFSVAVSGDTVVIGAPGEDSNATGVNGNQGDNSATSAGAAYVFVRSGISWSQEAYLKASNTDPGDWFGSSVAVSGDTVVVGAGGESSNATGVNGSQTDNSAISAGAAYVFVRNGTSWSQEAYLKASNTDLSDGFGGSVAVSGDTAVVGAFSESSNATGVNGNQADNSWFQPGAAYVFVRNGTSWSQQAYLKASNTDAGDLFGQSVAASGDTVVVGALFEFGGATGVNGNQFLNGADEAGAAYVFVRSGTSWSQEAYLKASNTDSHDNFGESVAVSGDTVVVGAGGEDSNATGVNGNQSDNSAFWSGAAYVFTRSGTDWSHQAYLKASNTGQGDSFGHSMAVSNDRVVVGAWCESNGTGPCGNQSDNSAVAAGAAYVFARSGTSWLQEAYVKSTNTDALDFLGWSVAVSGETVIVAARNEDSNATGVNGDPSDNSAAEAGAVYMFVPHSLGTSYCTATVNSTGAPAGISAESCTSISADSFSLFAEPVPASQHGVFFYGSGQMQLPFGNGFQCVAPGATGIARLPVVQASPLEVMTHQLDFSAPPTAATQITPGSTWNFQAWFRDPLAGGAFFNLSDGLTVTFGP